MPSSLALVHSQSVHRRHTLPKTQRPFRSSLAGDLRSREQDAREYFLALHATMRVKEVSAPRERERPIEVDGPII